MSNNLNIGTPDNLHNNDIPEEEPAGEEGEEGGRGGGGVGQHQPLTFSFSFSTNPTTINNNSADEALSSEAVGPDSTATTFTSGNDNVSNNNINHDGSSGVTAGAVGAGADSGAPAITQPNAASATAGAGNYSFIGHGPAGGGGGGGIRFSFSGNPNSNINNGAGGGAGANNNRPLTPQERIIQQQQQQELLRRHNIQIHAPPGVRVNLNGRGIPIRGGGGPSWGGLGRGGFARRGGGGVGSGGARIQPPYHYHHSNHPIGGRGLGRGAPPRRGGPNAAYYGRGGSGRGRGGRLPININVNTTTTTTNNNNNNSFNKLPKLQPQMLPEDMQEIRQREQQQQSSGSGIDGNDDDFKCAICYDIMNDPAGCGNCSARFCFACLKRVTELSAMQQQQQQANNNNNNSTGSSCRCPVCRSTMDDGPNDIQRDGALKRRMDLAPPITCRYVGCHQQILISQVAQHEISCPFVKMSCRYKTFGCSWSGKRADLIKHEQEECHLARVSHLVEQHRHMQVEMAQLSHVVAHLHQNLLANASIMELQRSREIHSLPSTGNVLQLLHYIQLLTCCTPRFLITKDTWIAFHGDSKGRATVSNFVTMLPTNILILKTLSTSYQQLLVSYRSSIETEDQLLDLLDSILYFMFVTLLAVVLGLCFYGEGSPDKWQPLPLQLSRITTWFGSRGNNNNNSSGPQQQQESNLLLYSAIFAMAASYSFALEMSQNWLRAALVWVYLCMASTVFPGMVTRMMVTVMNPPNAPVEVLPMIHSGRATRPIWLGLQYGVCAVCAVGGVEGGGILPSIDAAVTLFLTQDILKIPATMRPHSGEVGLLCNIPIAALYVYIGARLAMRATDFPQVGWIQSLDFLLMAIFVSVTQFLFLKFWQSGCHLGCHILHQSRQRINPTASPMLRTEYHGIGVSMFIVWGLLVGAIATT